MAFRIRRGLDSERLTVIPAEGELIYTTDTRQIYVGDGNTLGGNLVTSVASANAHSIASNLIPSANAVYDLGSPTMRWNKIYVSGNTIDLGGTEIKASASGISFTSNIVPSANAVYDLGSPTMRWNKVYVAGNTIDLGGTEIKASANGISFTDPANSDQPVPLTVSSITVSSGGNTVILTAGVSGLATTDSNGNVISIGASSNIGNLSFDNTFITSNVAVGIRVDTDEWVFEDGNLTLPPGGDILDDSGNSVLGGGTSSVPNTKRGFINLVGNKPNNDDDVFFESVVVHGQYAYVLGQDYLVDNSQNLTKVYKFNLETGNQVWVKQLQAGRGASFDFDITSNVITIANIVSGGGGYKAGEELHFYGYHWSGSPVTNLVTVIVDTVDGDGIIQTANIKAGYNLNGISNQTPAAQTPDNDNIQGDACAITYDTVNNFLIVASEYTSGLGDQQFDNNWTWTNLFVMDPANGNILGVATLSDDGDVYANAIKSHPTTGNVVVVGEKFGEFTNFGNLTMLATGNGYFDILKSDLDADNYPGAPYLYVSDFWIQGTGITGQDNVDNVNFYGNLATTVREGSGAAFTITANIDTTYTLDSLPGVDVAGINYLPGHKIIIPGTDLGGSSPTNDVIINVLTVDGNGGVNSYSVTSGVSIADGNTYSMLSGINYDVGSGAVLTAYVDAQTGNVSLNNILSNGSDYVTGDVLTIAGSNFANGTDIANNVTCVVNSVDGSTGAVLSLLSNDFTGTAPTDAVRVILNAVDFTANGGSWTMLQNLGSEAFVWTPNWSTAIGGGSSDRFYDFCWSQDGQSIFAVGRGRYEVTYDQALLVKFNAMTGAVVWGKDLRFTQAGTENLQARAVCLVPGSSDIVVAGGWFNGTGTNYDELIITRVTEAGAAVWQKTYFWNDNGNGRDPDFELSINAVSGNIVIGADLGTPIHSNGLGYMIINPADGSVIDNRVLSSDGNSNYNYYNTPTPQWADIYTDSSGDNYFVGAGHTYVPTDNYYNALLFKLPLDGYKNLNPGEYTSLGEHILGKYEWTTNTVTPAFTSFTATEHSNTITVLSDLKNYESTGVSQPLPVFKFDITDNTQGYLEFGDGSKQSFATDIIPQVPASNDYHLTEQDSGKHIFFEDNNGTVYIPHWTIKNLPVGFTFTLVTTSGTCYAECLGDVAGLNQGQFKLAGRNIQTYRIGIPDSGSGSMVTFLKVKSGYDMSNTDANTIYPDIWMVSGPGDVYDDA